MVEILNGTIFGWANCFRLGQAVDAHAARRLRRCLRRKHKAESGNRTRFPHVRLWNHYGSKRLAPTTKSLPRMKTRSRMKAGCGKSARPVRRSAARIRDPRQKPEHQIQGESRLPKNAPPAGSTAARTIDWIEENVKEGTFLFYAARKAERRRQAKSRDRK